MASDWISTGAEVFSAVGTVAAFLGGFLRAQRPAVDQQLRRRYPLLMSAEVKDRPKVTRVSRKNQVTLPVAALREAQVKAGDELEVTVDEHGRLVLTPVEDPLEALIGSMPGVSAAADLEAMRDEWAR